jgi:hypothetical protein
MTTTTMPMLETYPQSITLDRTKLAATIDTLIACSEACTACADACGTVQITADLDLEEMRHDDDRADRRAGPGRGVEQLGHG